MKIYFVQICEKRGKKTFRCNWKYEEIVNYFMLWQWCVINHWNRLNSINIHLFCALISALLFKNLQSVWCITLQSFGSQTYVFLVYRLLNAFEYLKLIEKFYRSKIKFGKSRFLSIKTNGLNDSMNRFFKPITLMELNTLISGKMQKNEKSR